MAEPEPRREHPRFDLDVSAELLLGDDRVPCRTKNLSMGGVGLVLRQKIAEHIQVVANLFVIEDGIEDATTPSINMQSVVVWVAEVDAGHWEAGLRFAQMSDEQRNMLAHFLQRLEPPKPRPTPPRPPPLPPG